MFNLCAVLLRFRFNNENLIVQKANEESRCKQAGYRNRLALKASSALQFQKFALEERGICPF
jgi:hypothetical protein